MSARIAAATLFVTVCLAGAAHWIWLHPAPLPAQDAAIPHRNAVLPLRAAGLRNSGDGATVREAPNDLIFAEDEGIVTSVVGMSAHLVNPFSSGPAVVDGSIPSYPGSSDDGALALPWSADNPPRRNPPGN